MGPVFAVWKLNIIFCGVADDCLFRAVLTLLIELPVVPPRRL